MPETKPSTVDQLRRKIGSDSASNTSKSLEPAPAASPLGTDDEAAGTTPTADRVEMARLAEDRIKAASNTKR